MEFSPHTTLASGCDTTVATEAEVVNLAAFADPAGGLGVLVLCVDEFISKDPADYEVLSYTAKNAVTDELEGLVHRAGTGRSWPAGTYAASYGTFWAWGLVAAMLNGAASLATPEALMVRDSDGRVRVADPDNAADAATKSFVETLAGRIVQVVTAASTTNDSTQSTSFVDTSLTCAITPKYDNSLLLVITSAHGDVRHQASGDAKMGRYATYALYNSTNTAYLQGAESVVYGRNLDAVSDKTTHSFYNVYLMGRYTVNSTAARTFVLRHSVPTEELISRIRGGESTALMTILEVKV